MEMRYERYYQYTSRWHGIYVSDCHDIEALREWCHNHVSNKGFHVCTEDRIPYRKIEHRHGYTYRFLFESSDDAFHFALTWCGEEAA